MHPKLQSSTVAIYARYSSDRQREASIEDQVRRCRQFIAQAGGDPDAAQVFSDFAVSGASLDRPGFEAMMAAIDGGRLGAIVTEDVSRISRDFADSAQIFKRLQYASVPLLGVADGIDTSSKNAKLSFTVKSLVADLYLDDLRDKTLRGLEGRALAGYVTGNPPFGYATEPDTDERGNVLGHRPVINEAQAAIVRRIFQEYNDGGSLNGIARMLNVEGVPSPRTGTRHKRTGWGGSTIRAMLYNEKYAGVWKFKERQWVKVPGSNKRRPRARNADEVMVSERPELRIIDAGLWDAVRARLAATKRKYTTGSKERVAVSGRKSSYLLSGILVCDVCGGPMTIHGGTSARYYRCSANRTKGTCENALSVREEVIRTEILDVLRQELLTPERIAFVRKQIALELRDYSKKLEAEIRDRRDRLARTEEKIRGLVNFIAQGDQSEYVVQTLRDMEAHARSEKAAIAQLKDDLTRPLRLPSLDEITDLVFNLDASLNTDPVRGRGQLRRWLKDEEIRLRPEPGGTYAAEGALLPLVVLADAKKRRPQIPQEDLWPIVRSGGRI